MSVLVTGATGGIGRTFVPLLADLGVEVVATGRNASVGNSLVRPGVRFVPADLLKDDLEPLVRGVEVIVHLAARSSPWGHAALFQADNVTATARVLRSAGEGGVRRFVYASSPAIFAERRHRLDIRADSVPASRPINEYARTKLIAENMVREERRMTTMILRPSAVLGPDDGAILPRLLRVIRHGLLPLGNRGSALFHPTDVRDAAEAFAAAALGTERGVVNVAGRAPVRVAELAGMLADRLALRLRITLLPEPLLHAAASAAEVIGSVAGREPIMTRYSASTLSWSRSFDMSDTCSRLDWRPRHGPVDALAHAVPG